ncbi:FtsX-like permease family protein [Bacteroides zoogleoformans]|uniref:FtsX-like permease family protein n=1 Tax=Bacteroides zoogleoformans TaxID=28119 RepID=UPI00248EBF69|nr:FtsX-like permease family protein [Bacteroides zoogleoformans]
MTKKLLTQIKNEWQGNVWLALELLVVSVVMWYIVDYIYTSAATYLEPRGFDIEHCYLINMGMLTDKSPDYIPNQTAEDRYNDVQEMLNRLQHRPDVEAVSLSQNSFPYNGSNSTTMVRYDTLESHQWTIRSLVTPDFVRVFRYRGTRGETPEQLAEILKDPRQFLASDNLYRKYDLTMTSLVGKPFFLFGDTVNAIKLGAALQNVRYSDYQQARSSYRMVYRLPDNMMDYSNEWCVRVRADQDRDFIDRLKADSEKLYRVGNLFIAEVRSFADVRENFQRSWMSQLRNYVVGMGFLLLNIFLGLLGTFWFRTQQRKSEIALHKAHGATDGGVFRRLLCEGWLLLLLVTPLALLVDYHLADLELNSWRNGTTLEWERLLLCAVISFLLMALMIAVGIGIPARKAMNIQPAEALHDE